jgi:hypothetical protein
MQDRVLITGPVGNWAVLDRSAFESAVMSRRATQETAALLQERGFSTAEPATENSVARMRRRLAPLFKGPSHHALVVTTRPAPGAPGMDMPLDLAERVVDTAFMSTHPRITLELCGGEPLAAFDVVRHAVDYARKKNLLARKFLGFVLHTGLQGLNDEQVRWLADERVRLRVPFVGPAELHDAVAAEFGGGPAALVERWAPLLRAAYLEAGVASDDAHLSLWLPMVGSAARRADAVLAAYTRVGAFCLDVSPFAPIPLALTAESTPLATPELFSRAYSELLHELLARSTSPRVERTACDLLRRIQGDDIATDTLWRAPSSAGLGELAYAPDGLVFATRKGYALHMGGDSTFALADVRRSGYHDIVTHPTVRALAVASALESHPEWLSSAYAPYLCTSPVDAYLEQGSVHGRLRELSGVLRQEGMLDAIFAVLAGPNDTKRAALDGWVAHCQDTSFYE